MRLGKPGFVICVGLLFVCGSCSYRFAERNHCLKVSSPEYLKDTYACAISDLGIPEHEGTLSGVVVYPKANQKACSSFIDHQLSFKTKTLGSLPILLLVDRGDCYLMLKAWNAQKAGAAGILIADDWPKSLNTLYSSEEIDVDFLENITIPSAMVSRSIGDRMKKALYNGDFVRLNLEWADEYHELQKDSDEECDDHIEEHDIPMWRFIIKPNPLWEFLVSWSTRLWTNGYI